MGFDSHYSVSAADHVEGILWANLGAGGAEPRGMRALQVQGGQGTDLVAAGL